MKRSGEKRLIFTELLKIYQNSNFVATSSLGNPQCFLPCHQMEEKRDETGESSRCDALVAVKDLSQRAAIKGDR